MDRHHFEQLPLPECCCTAANVFDLEFDAAFHHSNLLHNEFAAIPAAHAATKERCCALLAMTADPPVLTYTAASTLLAPTADPSVLADAAASTLLALPALSSVLTDAAASAPLAITAPPSVLADAVASTLLAPTALLPVLTFDTLQQVQILWVNERPQKLIVGNS